MRRRADAVAAALGALLAFVFGLLGAPPAFVVKPLSTYEASAYDASEPSPV